MKRLLRCEEWAKLRIGSGSELLTVDDVTSILRTWRQNTGTDPAAYFDLGPESITPKFWSGSLETSRLRLEVAPIGSGDLNAEQLARLDHNLSAMLAYASSSQSLKAGSAFLSIDGHRYEVLVAVFCEELQLARRRLVLRRYVQERDSLATPRGRISFPRQCYEAVRRPGRFASEWVALTEDIAENRIFKAVLIRYRPRCSASLRSKIDACIAELDTVQNPSDLRIEWSRVRRDRLPKFYTSLLTLSKALLDDVTVGVFAGDMLATAEVLFTSRLFERYVAKELSWLASEFALSAKVQSRGTFLCSSSEGGSAFEIIPDVRLMRSCGSTAVVLDTKWKHVDNQTGQLNVSRTDIYQILVYGAKHSCSTLVLLYPDVSEETGNMGAVRTFSATLAGVKYSIHVVKLPMLGKDLMVVRAFLRKFLFDTGLPP